MEGRAHGLTPSSIVKEIFILCQKTLWAQSDRLIPLLVVGEIAAIITVSITNKNLTRCESCLMMDSNDDFIRTL